MFEKKGLPHKGWPFVFGVRYKKKVSDPLGLTPLCFDGRVGITPPQEV